VKNMDETEVESEPMAPGTSTPKRALGDNGKELIPPKSAEYISVDRKPSSRSRRGPDWEGSEKKVEMTTDEKRQHFNLSTRNNPDNVCMWREFVDFQDEDCNDLRKKARVEKKVSILETALRKCHSTVV